MRRASAVAAVAAALWLLLPRPPLAKGKASSQRVFDRNGRLLRITLSPDEKYRLWTPLAGQSRELIAATLHKEDRWFYRHPGVNPVSLVRAAWSSLSGGPKIGGSTLTMQLARVRWGLKTRTAVGKLRQVLHALHIELFYSKDEILEAYLNLAPYGGNIEGAGAAALVYFSKEPGKISAQEARWLAELPQRPSRRGRLLELRKDSGGRDALPFHAPHFVSRVLAEDHGRSPDIGTTLDLSLQTRLEEIARSFLEERRGEGVDNAAMVLLDHRDMSVAASVGSADFFDAGLLGQVDGTRARRSPGSALKPFLYALAMDQGLIHPATLLKDAPSRFNGYSPENFDGKFEGPLSARQALIRSRNVPAVELASRLRGPDFYDFLRSAGLVMPLSREAYGLAPVLGGVEISPEHMAVLYAMLASGGALRGVRTRQDAEPGPARRLISAEAAYLTLDILSGLARPKEGFSGDWVDGAVPVFWKTGTSYGFRDAWAAGIFGQYVLVVWLGNFDGRENPALVGATAAGPLFFRVVDALRPELADAELLSHARLGSLEAARVCAVSGDAPGPACPHTEKTWLIPGVSPIKKCGIHRAVLVDAGSGLRACLGSGGGTSRAMEFWPSDLLRLFEKAGLPRRRPPAPAPGCAAGELADTGAPPRITSPQDRSSYALRMESAERTLSLEASADADARELYWFSGESFIGKSPAGKPLFWKPAAGRSVLRVVDEHGRSDASVVQVTWVK